MPFKTLARLASSFVKEAICLFFHCEVLRARRDAGEESEEIRFKVVAVFVAMGENKRTRETMLDIYR